MEKMKLKKKIKIKKITIKKIIINDDKNDKEDEVDLLGVRLPTARNQ